MSNVSGGIAVGPGVTLLLDPFVGNREGQDAVLGVGPPGLCRRGCLDVRLVDPDESPHQRRHGVVSRHGAVDGHFDHIGLTSHRIVEEFDVTWLHRHRLGDDLIRQGRIDGAGHCGAVRGAVGEIVVDERRCAGQCARVRGRLRLRPGSHQHANVDGKRRGPEEAQHPQAHEQHRHTPLVPVETLDSFHSYCASFRISAVEVSENAEPKLLDPLLISCAIGESTTNENG